MSDIVEVVDLTSPSPPRTTIALANSDANLVDSPTPSGLENRKARRRKSRKSSTNALLDSPASRSRNNSVERIPEPQSDRRVKRKRRSASPETPGGRENRRFRQDEKKPPAAEPKDIFFVDLTSTATPSSQETQVISNPENGSSSKLLLPSHVTVFGSTPVEVIPQPLSDSDDDGFIKYLDYDDARDTLRYYDEPPSKVAALDRTVCKNCGAEGEHKTSACPNQICLTCGARNEHSTRSCPISKVCFTCGMKGHINSNCPNRRTARALMSTRENECDRCSSDRHKTNACSNTHLPYLPILTY
ncbi:hypothetical protein B0H34DRAFT_235944 [Crassisporium funariophilum]|nr:hypothetical protein B0H34DRAFT_235944 [Crassisporium funariophilum]